MSEAKRAGFDHPVHDLVASRWSPYAYDGRPVPGEDLAALFEAARWAPSSYNEQPWRYIVATQADGAEFERLLSCLVEANQSWAKQAPVLALGLASLNFARNGKPNTAAFHDLGAASAHLTFEATARGLHVHQMIGILPERARELYTVPEGFEALTALAIGYREAGESEFAERDRAARSRRPGSEFVFAGEWEAPFGGGG
jgi:nitroreductase